MTTYVPWPFRRCRVALIVPSDANAAAAVLLALIDGACAVPLHAAEERAVAVQRARDARVDAVVAADREAALEVATAVGVPAVLWTADGTFVSLCGALGGAEAAAPRDEDVVLILHTSGTTGRSKRVPFTRARLNANGTLLARSMDLGAHDVGLNMMPLHHVGGIACNLIGARASGCRMIHAPFDASAWWRIVRDEGVTWCYMTPSMWSMILRATPAEPAAPPTLRLLRSGAAPLPHALALRLVETFPSAHVLPTYSMTECMPIASPPANYGLSRPGAVGPPVGDLRVVALDRDGRVLPANGAGELALSGGEQLFAGYEGEASPRAADEPFRTGDVGFVDEDGWIHVTGRQKECINRGGELLFPVEIEATLALERETMIFAAPHDELGEVVGLAVVGRPTRDEVCGSLALHKRPQVVVRVDALPRTRGTGKVQRVGFAERIGLPRLRGSRPRTFSWCDDTLRDESEATHDDAASHSCDALLARMAEAIPLKLAQRHTRDDRVRTSASGTAKYTLRMRHLAHRLGFGTDRLATALMPAFWDTEWPRAWEELHTQTLCVAHGATGSIVGRNAVWSTLFRERIGSGECCDGCFGVGYMHGRTCFFDEVVASHAWCEQLVVLGAGYDTRCYRMARLPARLFEVDAPTTQECKRRHLREAGIDGRHVTYVSVDFTSEDWFQRLKDEGFDPKRSTLFVWEGVSYYLPRAAVLSTLSVIATECACARIVFDVYHAWFSDHAKVSALMRKGFGEPLRFGVATGDEDEPARTAGLRTAAVVLAHELNETYGPWAASGELSCPALGASATVVAEVSADAMPPVTTSVKEKEGVAVAADAEPPKKEEAVAHACQRIEATVGRALDADVPLAELGLDSLSELEIRELLDVLETPFAEGCTLRDLIRESPA